MQDFSQNTPNDPFFNAHNRGVVPASAVFQDAWPSSGTLTQGLNGGLSMAGWTEGNEGFIQQSFLGASVRNFNIQAGFGGTTSTASIDLVNDEYHKSDGTNIGLGDDVYHGGEKDHFNPPVVGSPVFFKFGKNHATVEQAYRQTFDDLYNYQTMPEHSGTKFDTTVADTPIEEHPNGSYLASGTKLDEVHDGSEEEVTWVDKSSLQYDRSDWRGKYHFVFGGILQSYTQNKSSAGNPLYNVKLVDPRDILGNTQVVLSNYQGTTFNNKNMYNVYGFLEYDPSDALKAELVGNAYSIETLTKFVAPNGEIGYQGQDVYRYDNASVTSFGLAGMENVNRFPESYRLQMPPVFPITGQGFSRRSSRGMPFYRISQALSAMFQERGYLPKEYRDAGFGGTIDFRGYQYVVDFSGLPLDRIPDMYQVDFDKIDLLSLAQEICEITSHELYVSLLPVIDHPACAFLYEYNQEIFKETNDSSLMIAGIIRVDAIDRSQPPKYGSIKTYIDELADHNIFVENQDVGFEVSNVTTDKFVAGAQEVDMYYFSAHRDRDTLQERRARAGKSGGRNNLHFLESEQWALETSLKQQILPFYGFLDDKAVTIPRGFGGYQQIMLDAKNLDAHGVGNYYIATEMELRAASVSYEAWEEFLLYYNERYIDEVGQYQAVEADLSKELTKVVRGINSQTEPESSVRENLQELLEDGRQFAVSVPRCVFNSDKPNCAYRRGSLVQDGYPASPCSPPFGYPLYYKRAEKIGILRAGVASLYNNIHTCITNIERLRDMIDSEAAAFGTKPDLADALDQLVPLQKRIAQVKKAIDQAKSTGANTKVMETQLKNLSYLLESAQRTIANAQEEIDRAVRTEKALSASVRKALGANRTLTVNANYIAKYSQKNAKKVHAFIKKIADECLGKKFLVKIPKTTNLTYSDNVSWFEPALGNIAYGPFGFRPIPISTDPRYSESEAFNSQLAELAAGTNANTIFEHYLNNDYVGRYTNGALKCNFNPITEKWEHNYQPENQGGYASFGQYVAGAHNAFLQPVSMQKLINDNNRVSAYVRFNNSQFIDFSNFNPKDVEQQTIGGNGQFIPDASENLDNLNPDKTESLDKISARLSHDRHYRRQAPSVAFVKCTIDDDFYMSPQIISGPMTVFANEFTVAIPPPDFETVDVPAPEKMPADHPADGDDPYGDYEDPYEYQGELSDNYDSNDGSDDDSDDSDDSQQFNAGDTVYVCTGLNGDCLQVDASELDFMTGYVSSHATLDACLAACGEVPVDEEEGWGWECVDEATAGRPGKCAKSQNGQYETEQECLDSSECSGDDGGGGDHEEGDGKLVDNPMAGCIIKQQVLRRLIPIFGVPLGGGSDGSSATNSDFLRTYSSTFRGNVVVTRPDLLDSRNVYALITLPGKAIPTVDQRFVDSFSSTVNTPHVYSILTRDVVKIYPFRKPSFARFNGPKIDCNDINYSSLSNTTHEEDGSDGTLKLKGKPATTLSFEQITSAMQAQRDAMKGIALGGDFNLIKFTAPSPVYPDLAVLPLMSMER